VKRPVTTVAAALALALCAGLGLVFLNAYRKGITVRLGETGQPNLTPPPPSASSLPDEQPPRYTNEQLHSMLEEETSRLGIQRLAPRGEREREPFGGFLGPRLGADFGRTQAETAIHEIARLRRTMDSEKQNPVPISGRIVPVLAEPEPGGAAVEPTAKIESSPDSGRSRHTAGQEEALPQTSSPGAWSGLYGGAEEGTLTISDAKAWADLWSRLSRQAAPDLDFSRHQIVGVFLGPQSTGGYHVEISSTVTVLPTAVVVHYRVFSPADDRTPPEGATSPYALLSIERTSLPVRFDRKR
jgi:hypothetical protein